MRKVSAVAIIILLGCVSAWAFAQVAFPVFTTPNLAHSRIDTYLSNATWTAPAGVTTACPELWGAGGGGTTAVGGGGGGAYALKCEAVTPGTGYAVVVGTGAANADGGDTTFNSTDVVAKGGKSGTNGGAGGAASGSTGTTKFSGGAGRVNAGNSGGGGGAGTTQNGGTSSSSSGGTPGDFFGGTGGHGLVGTEDAREYASGGPSTGTTGTQGRQGVAWINYQWAPGPGYPTVVARAASRSGASTTTTHVIGIPSGTGGMLGVFFSSRNGTIAISSITAGWTTACNANSGSSGNNGAFFYKLSTGSDALTVTMASATESVSRAIRVTGTSVIPVCATATSSTQTANSDPPSLTYPGGTAPIYWVAARLGTMDSSQSSTVVSAPPSGYYDFQYLSSTTNIGTAACCDVSIAGKHTKAATEDPGAYTSNAERWVTVTAAFVGTTPLAGVFAPGSYSWWIYPIALQVGANTYANYVAANGNQIALNLDGYGNYVKQDALYGSYTVDEHAAPAVQSLNDGNLLWAWSGHNVESKIWYYKSSGTTFPLQSAITATSLTTSNVASYTQLITRSDSVWWFYRVSDSNWAFRKSTDNAATWAAEQGIWTSGSAQIYMLPRKLDADTVRVLVTENGGNANNHLWIAKLNLSTGDISSGSGSLGNLSGTSLPITYTTLTAIYDAPANYGVRLLDMKDDGSAFTYVKYDLDDSPFDANYYIARFTGADPNTPADWTHTLICASGHEFFVSTSHYFGGVVFANEPHSGLRLYVSRESSGTWLIERWDSANGTGSDWVATQLQSSAINFLLRPESPIGATTNFPVYWQQGPSYTSFTVFNLNVVDR